MEQFTIRCIEDNRESCCPVCAVANHKHNGPRLFLADCDDPICRNCGKKLAPSLVALIDLAQTAEKVGRSCRHLLTPPMESLLALARAAENYSHAAPRTRAAVAA